MGKQVTHRHRLLAPGRKWRDVVGNGATQHDTSALDLLHD